MFVCGVDVKHCISSDASIVVPTNIPKKSIGRPLVPVVVNVFSRLQPLSGDGHGDVAVEQSASTFVQSWFKEFDT